MHVHVHNMYVYNAEHIHNVLVVCVTIMLIHVYCLLLCTGLTYRLYDSCPNVITLQPGDPDVYISQGSTPQLAL